MTDVATDDCEVETEEGEGEGEDATRRDDDVTETTTQGYGSKMANASCGAVFGLLLFFGSFGLLVWNEARTVSRDKDLDDGRADIIDLDLNDLNATSLSTLNNKLIHATGPLSTPDVLFDPDFGFTTRSDNSTSNTKDVLKLSRSVSMYQWVETSSTTTYKDGKGNSRTKKKYSLKKKWSSSLVASSTFRTGNSGTVNPTAFPFDAYIKEAAPIVLGDAVHLSDQVIGMINWYEPYDVNKNIIADSSLQSKVTDYGSNGFFYSASTGVSHAPLVGDTRVAFAAVPADTVSIVARFEADGGSLDSYPTERGGSILLVKRGSFSANELFTEADEQNTQLAWLLRFLGFLMMFLSICLILNPVAASVDVLPFIGDCLEGTLQNCLFPAIAFVITVPLWMITISLAWLAYRPSIAIPIFLVCAVILAWIYLRVRAKKHKLDDEAAGESLTTTYGQEQEVQVVGLPSNDDIENSNVDMSMTLSKPPPATNPNYVDAEDEEEIEVR